MSRVQDVSGMSRVRADSERLGARRRLARHALLAAPILLVGILSASPAFAGAPAETPPPATASAHPTAATTSAGLGQAAATIALGEVGVGDTPVSRDFGLDCNPFTTMVGPDIPNDNGCGYNARFGVQAENEVWCSDFVKWAWMKAGVTADLNLINAGSDSFLAWGQAQGQAMPVDSTDAQVGDAVVFFPPGAVSPTRYADHVGIVTAVNADGTLNLVNGDFRQATNIGVEYDQNVTLSTWASQVWNRGEQWVFVAPPSTAQQPAPAVSLSGPHHAVANTSVMFHARASQPNGSVASYLWSFGDGGNADAATATHVFGSAGLHTVSLTATSDAGTATVGTWNVTVDAASSTVASTPSDANWYSVTPVNQSLFFQSSSGGLARDVWNGAEWSYEALPGQLAASAGLTVLDYADPTDEVMQAHAFYRAADGALAETFGKASGWATAALPGHPAADSPMVASTRPGCAASGGQPGDTAASPGVTLPSVYYFDDSGRLNVTYATTGGWATAALPVAPTPYRALALALTASDGSTGTALFSLDGRGALTALTAASSRDCGWQATTIATPGHVSASTALSAIAVGDGGDVQVVFAGQHGELTSATSSAGGAWLVVQIPHVPSVTGSIATTTNLLASGALREDVFYLGPAGHPVHATAGDRGWTAETLSTTATGITGIADFPRYIPPGEVNLRQPAALIGGQTESLLLASGPQLSSESTNAESTGWTPATLPTDPGTFADSIRLYAATPADHQTALDAAAFAGLPASQVTQSFFTAWADALSGRYLVISVGQAATGGLYYKVCGWPNPAGEIAGGTPFGYTVAPTTAWPGAELYLNGLASATGSNADRVDDLAYYATHGALPPGVTAVPAAGRPAYTCSGQPNGS
jgi:FOG: PKD repeat